MAKKKHRNAASENGADCADADGAAKKKTKSEIIPVGGLKMETGLFINGEFVKSKSGETFETVNPATEEVITSVHAAGEEDVNLAVAAAKEAFKTWKFTDGSHRRNLLLKLADLIEKHRKQLSEVESLDNGKPVHCADAIDLGFVIECYRYYAGWADKIGGKVISANQGTAGNFCYARHEPIGVCGLIVPWNFPLLMQAWKLAPALAMGCTCVMKLSEKTPLSGMMIMQLFKEAGFPPGTVNIVNGFGSPTGELIARHPDISKIAFTGSTAVGKKIVVMAAESNLKKVSLELGGKSALIVCKDADLDQAAMASHVGNWINMGQCCTASSRVFVHEDVYDEFAKKVTKLAKRLRTAGDTTSETDVPICDLGPQVDKIQFDKIMHMIKVGKKQGAKCLVGGDRVQDTGYYVQPTIFADVTDNMKIAKAEIFGPVMSMLKFKTLDEAIERANSSAYGLAAGVMTRDVGLLCQAAARLNHTEALWCWGPRSTILDRLTKSDISGAWLSMARAGTRQHLEYSWLERRAWSIAPRLADAPFAGASRRLKHGFGRPLRTQCFERALGVRGALGVL